MGTDKASSQVEDIDFADGRRVTLALPIAIIEDRRTKRWSLAWSHNGTDYQQPLEAYTQAEAWKVAREVILKRITL